MRVRGTALLVLAGLMSSPLPALADKITRTVDSQGVPTITIRGQQKPAPAPQATPAPPPVEFQVYELEGSDPTPEPARQPPAVVVIPSPPPIAPNPAAYGYYGPYGYPPLWPSNCAPSPYPLYGPANGLIGPVNYQNPAVNYQPPPVNYQPRPLPPPGLPPRPSHSHR